MDTCEIRDSISKETLSQYGVKSGVVYKVADGEHQKDGALFVHLIAPNDRKIEIPIEYIVFHSAHRLFYD
jgi:hypothetical protein